MIVAVTPQEDKAMSFEEIVRVHIDRLGMTREQAEIRAWFLTASEDEFTDADGNPMLLG